MVVVCVSGRARVCTCIQSDIVADIGVNGYNDDSVSLDLQAIFVLVYYVTSSYIQCHIIIHTSVCLDLQAIFVLVYEYEY